jgi:hypothetical protein
MMKVDTKKKIKNKRTKNQLIKENKVLIAAATALHSSIYFV